MNRKQESRRRTAVFLIVAYAGIQAFLWLVVPTRITWAIAVGAVAILTLIVLDPRRRGETAAAVGVTGRNLVEAMKLLALPTLGVAGLLLLWGYVLQPQLGDGRLGKRFVEILPWALLQQSLLQIVFNRRLTAAFGPGLRTSLWNGVAFGLMHLPGPLLTFVTFAAGTWWSSVYQKRPNIWALVISHAILSAAAQSVLPDAWTHGFRVGPGYFRWQP